MNRLQLILAFLIDWNPPAEALAYVFAVEPEAGMITVNITTCCLSLTMKIPGDAVVEKVGEEMAKFAEILVREQAEKHRGQLTHGHPSVRSEALQEGADKFMESLAKSYRKPRGN